MKKLSLLLLLLLPVFVLFAQVERERVVIEIGTGTWCSWCPGAAQGADDMVEAGHDVAVIENHNGDNYANQYSNARNGYYGITGYPTTKFDGVLEHGGGAQCPNPSGLYSIFLAKYNQRKAVSSAFNMLMWGDHTGDNYTVTIEIEKVASATTTNCVVQFVLTESHIQQNWQGCMTECNFVNRLMVPDQNGTPLELSGDEQTIELEFSVSPSWVEENCEVIAFIQNNTTKEIYQATMKELLNLEIPPVEAEFTADQTVLCSGTEVQYTDMSSGFLTSWSWQFPGGTPATSNQQNPTIVYSTAGEYDVTLTVSDGTENDSQTKSNYIHVASAAPVAPAAPTGESMLCKNPENQEYTTSGSPEAYDYEWAIDPTTAGYIMGTGQTVTINFVNAFTGEASITCNAVNGCGESDYSEPLALVINERPEVFNISGGGAFCEGGEGVEIVLDNSDEGVEYEVWADDKPTENILAGTGATLTFMVSDTGICTIVGTSLETLCPNTMENEVMVTEIPYSEVFNINGGGEYCEGTTGAEIGLDGSQPGVSYDLLLDDVATGISTVGTGDPITFGEQTDEGVYSVVAIEPEIGCDNMMEGTTEVTMIPLPEVPATPDGPDYVDLVYTQTTEYTMVPGPNSTSCNWNLEPASAGDINVLNTTTCEVNWDLSFLGDATLTVRNINDCGESNWSEGLVIMIDNTVGFDNPVTDLGLKISPNPTTGQFKVFMNTNREELVTIKVFNSLNAVVFEINNVQVNGKFSQTINLDNEASGIYFISIESSSDKITKKLVKQ